jgi:spoIIIJ-associated protein
MEWVEVRGSTVEIATQGALEDLGLSSPDEAEIEVLEEPAKGFLGMGSKEALVRVTRKPKEKRQRRRKRSGGGQQRTDSRQEGKDQKSGSRTQQSGKSSRERTQRKPSDAKAGSSGGGGGGSRQNQSKKSKQAKDRTMEESTAPEVEIDAEGQAAVVAEFLNGLLDSFGLEGDVATSVEDDLILANVTGEQTEALIGPKGSIMQSVGELTRTVVQRKTHRRARLRLDVGGYQERRREALRIYTARLAEQVLDDGGEIMLEPMNPADRKTVHDAVVDIEGVSSFSEGEEPNRSVVIALAPGVEPRSKSSEAEGDDAVETDDSGSVDTSEDVSDDASDDTSAEETTDDVSDDISADDASDDSSEGDEAAAAEVSADDGNGDSDDD